MPDVKDSDDILRHYGKLGMKWGHHKTQLDKSGIPRSGRARDDAIRSARARQQKRMGKLQNLAGATYTGTSEKGILKAVQIYVDAENKVLAHPDADTAAKMTRGEKWTQGLQWAGVAALAVAVVGTSAVKAR